MKRTLILLPLIAAGVFGINGCSTVQYGDATAVETVNTDFGSTDLQMIAEKMTDDLLASPAMAEIAPNGKRPILFVDTIKNKTLEHIDTESITDTISTKMLNSGRFRFVDMTRVDAVAKQLDYQKNSGMVDERKSVQMGRQLGAQFMLYGNFSSIEKTAGSTKDVYYKFTMKLTNIESGLVEFQSEKEIRKTKKKSMFGT
ncbi:MAG: penicillin-binding protein activator LpoB [bacterium]|nr:penicillin-binding protein activator LpoB [bacterium]